MEPLCAALLAKIEEQIERTAHLLDLLPPGALDAPAPLPACWTAAELLDHLLECLAGFCAVLAAAEPDRLAHFGRLRDLRANRSGGIFETRQCLDVYRVHLQEGFALLRDADLARPLPTLFVPAGEPILTLLLGNLEHTINHKHQLFTYLKAMGVDVGSRDLYRFRA